MHIRHNNIVYKRNKLTRVVMSSKRTPTELVGYAVETDHVQDLQKLILNGFDIESRDEGFNPTTPAMTVLCFAASLHRMEIILALIALGANVNSPTLEGFTPLHVAIQYMNTLYENTHYTRNIDVTVAVVRLLIHYGADVSASDCAGETPLHTAARLGEPTVVQLLLDHGAQVLYTCSSGFSAVGVCREEIKTMITGNTDVKSLALFWMMGKKNTQLDRYRTTKELLETASIQQLKFQHACDAEFVHSMMEGTQTDSMENLSLIRDIFDKLHPQFITVNSTGTNPQDLFNLLIRQGYLNPKPDVPRVFPEILSTPL